MPGKAEMSMVATLTALPVSLSLPSVPFLIFGEMSGLGQDSSEAPPPRENCLTLTLVNTTVLRHPERLTCS